MQRREEIVAGVASRVQARFSARGGVQAAPAGELNGFIVTEIKKAVAALENPFADVIRGWAGKGHELDLCWWEEEDNPESIVLGLAGAILDYEVRQSLQLPL